MYLLFALIGFLGIPISLIMLIIYILQKISKREATLKGKYIVASFIITIVCFSIGLAMTPDSTKEASSGEETINNTTEATTELKAEATTQTTTQEKKKEESIEKPKKTNPLDDGIKKYKTKKYRYITNSDLETYAPNMKEVKVYTVVTVGELDDGKIKASLNDDKFMFSTFDVGERFDKYKKLFKEGDKIAILGKVDNPHDYSFMGKSIALTKCYVFANGKDAEKYDKEKSSKKLSKYFKVTEEVAKSSDVSKEEYKDLCNYLDYEDVLRNPDSYKKKYCVVSGSVDQIIEGFFNTFTIYVEDSDGNKWECIHTYEKGDSHVLEGDHVTMYGQCKGTTTATTLLGKQVTLPEIDVEYID